MSFLPGVLSRISRFPVRFSQARGIPGCICRFRHIVRILNWSKQWSLHFEKLVPIAACGLVFYLHCACFARDAIVLPLLYRFLVYGRKRFHFSIYGRRVVFKIEKENPFSKISRCMSAAPLALKNSRFRKIYQPSFFGNVWSGDKTVD